MAAVDPGEPGRYPPCPLLAATGLYCPFCGGLRAVHALTRLDVAASLGWNALAIPLVALAVAWWIAWVRRARRGQGTGTARRPILSRRALWSIGLVLAAYGVARNLPVLAVLAPHG